jgi:hypothetical protein
MRRLNTLVFIAIGGIVYLAMLMAIDKEARNPLGEMAKEIRQK